MRLRGVNWRLCACLTTEEIAIVRVDSDGGRNLDRPWSERFRAADLGFQRPAIAADIHQFRVIILPERHDNAQARANDQILPVIFELRRRQRGAPTKFIENRNAGSPKPVTKRSRGIPMARPFANKGAVRHEDVELCRLAEHADASGESDDADVCIVSHVIQRQSGIGQHASFRIPIASDEKIRVRLASCCKRAAQDPARGASSTTQR